MTFANKRWAQTMSSSSPFSDVVPDTADVPLTPIASGQGTFGGVTSARQDSKHFRRHRLQESIAHLGGDGSLSDKRSGPLASKTRLQQLQAWMINNGQRRILFVVWIVLHALVFSFGMVTYQLSDNLTQARAIFGVTYAVARAAALTLNVDAAFVLLPVCRNFVTLIRRTPLNGVIPLDAGITFHIVVACTILFFTAVHIVAHMVNFARHALQSDRAALGFLKLNLASGPGITGWFMTACLVVMTCYSTARVRHTNYERFWFSHHLFVILFASWQLHGMFCMIKPDRPPFCSWTSHGVLWKYFLPGGLMYIHERVLRRLRSRRRTVISKVIQHPGRVIEIHIRKEKTAFKAGQYILLNCPDISYWQWHPFTITSAPEEEFISLHIRMTGDFTRTFGQALGCHTEPAIHEQHVFRTRRNVRVPAQNRAMPRVLLDGPFGSASEDYYKFETVMLIGAGIGVTPFASILKSIWYRAHSPMQGKTTRLSKVYFIWICRDLVSFGWFQSVLLALEAQDLGNLIEINTYTTTAIDRDQISNLTLQDIDGDHDPVTGLRARTHYGRPDFDRIFASVCKRHPATDVGVFVCGPSSLDAAMRVNLDLPSR